MRRGPVSRAPAMPRGCAPLDDAGSLQRRPNTAGREGRLVQAHARRVVERVGDRAHHGTCHRLEHTCEVHVSALRRKIEDDPTEPRRLLTVRGEGCSLAFDV